MVVAEIRDGAGDDADGPDARAAEAETEHGADRGDPAAAARAREAGAGGEVGRLGAVEQCGDVVLEAVSRPSGSATTKTGQNSDARRSRDTCRSRTVARQAVQWRRCGRIWSTWAAVAAPAPSAWTIGAKRSHSSPDSIPSYALMNRRRPSVIARLTFVYDQPLRAPISSYESPCAFIISAFASSGFSARSASAERRTRSPDGDLLLDAALGRRDERVEVELVAGHGLQRARRIAIASWRTTTFSHATSVAGSTVSTRRTKISSARW